MPTDIFSVKVLYNIDYLDLLENIKSELQDRGWNIVYWAKNSAWGSIGGGNYGWISGNGANLAIESIGYGNQCLHFRIFFYPDIDPSNAVGQLGSCISSMKTINTNSSTHPINQNNWARNGYGFSRLFSFLSRSIKAWIFSTDRFCIVAMQCSPQILMFFSFGSIELFDSSETQGMYCGYPCLAVWGGSEVLRWNSQYTYYGVPGDTPQYVFYINNSNPIYSEMPFSFFSMIQDGNNYTKYFANMAYLHNVNNSWSDIKLMQKQIVYYKKPTDVFYRPIGTMPFFRCRVNSGLIEEKIISADKEFYVFPNVHVDRKAGIAIRTK